MFNPEIQKSCVLPSTLWPLPGQPKSDDPYRGFVQVGRCGTGKARPGEKGDGKTLYFLTEGCAYPGREARSVLGTATAIEEVWGGMVRSLQVEGLGHWIKGLGHRIPPRPQVYAKSETFVFEMVNTIRGAGRRVAQGAQITGKMDSAPHGPVRKPPDDEDLPESFLFR